MKEIMDVYVIEENAPIMQALKKMDGNKKGFLIVLKENGEIFGTLSDVDIRHAFITGAAMDDPVAGVCKRNAAVLSANDTISSAIDIFKNPSVGFVPIIDDGNRLVNMITKAQLHFILLQDMQVNLMYNFLDLDDRLVDYEVDQRPWGFYKTTVKNDYCQTKILCVYPGAQLSLQSHDHREEHWVIAHGKGTVQIESSVFEAQYGNSFFIPKGCRHRLTNLDSKETLVITEVQIGDYLGEDDIRRYDDIYGRT